jgi:DNA polymerase I-like protein with 3'-5' exonuclease and polymerase domains
LYEKRNPEKRERPPPKCEQCGATDVYRKINDLYWVKRKDSDEIYRIERLHDATGQYHDCVARALRHIKQVSNAEILQQLPDIQIRGKHDQTNTWSGQSSAVDMQELPRANHAVPLPEQTKQGRHMSIITLDFETFYSQEFSLSKMTTESYIRDKQFEVIGFAYSIDGAEPRWVTGNDDYIGDRLHELELHKHSLLCHNTAFDGAILAWRYGIVPKQYFDTLSMARPLHAHTVVGGSLAKLAKHYGLPDKGKEVLDAKGKHRNMFTAYDLAMYGKYCQNDVLITWQLFHKLLPHIPKKELYLIDLFIRMYTDPVLELDAELLESHLHNVRETKHKLLERIKGADPSIFMSNPKFAKLLQHLGVEPPLKTSPANGQETYAFSKTDPAFKALQDHDDPRVQTVVAARLGLKSTLEETRTESLIGVASRGKLPILLNYYGAATGRASGGDKMNLQNLPSRGGKNTIRRAIMAPEGHKLVVCDSSQIEARIVAWLAGQDELVQAFAEKKDVYKLMASLLYSITVDEVDTQQRFIGKTVTLGCGYGMSANKFKDYIGLQGVKLDDEEAQRIITKYRKANNKIARLWYQVDEILKGMAAGKILSLGPLEMQADNVGFHLPNDMVIRYPGLRWDAVEQSCVYDSKYGAKKIYGAAAVENIVQALARIVVFDQMMKMNAEMANMNRPGRLFRTVMSVHDETVLVVPDDSAEWALKRLMEHMFTPPKWAPDLPVACEGSIAQRYGEAK